MPLIHMPDCGFYTHCVERYNPSGAQKHLLDEPHIPVIHVKAFCDLPVFRRIVLKICIQKEERNTSDLNLSYPCGYASVVQRYGDHQDVA